MISDESDHFFCKFCFCSYFLNFLISLHSILFYIHLRCTAVVRPLYSLYIVQYSAGTIHVYYNIIEYIPYTLLNPCDYSVMTSLYFLIPSPFLPNPPTPSHLATTGWLFDLRVCFHFICLFYIVLQIPNTSEIIGI